MGGILKGSDAFVQTLIDSGVEVCFGNPGTSEMHLVAALDRYPQLRGVLCLFEGVATGAADGYGRMTGRPAATLLHLGPGLSNGLANLHNARRAGTPVLNVVGDHSMEHKVLDSPGDSDIDAIAGSVSAWVCRPADTASLGRDVAEAVGATMGVHSSAGCRTGTSGAVATVIVRADLTWAEGAVPADPVQAMPAQCGPAECVGVVEKVLRSGEPVALLLDGDALTDRGLCAADRIAQVTGARMYCPTWPAHLRRGAGVPVVTPLSYRGEDVAVQMDGVRHLVLAGARPPVATYGYPGKSGELTPTGVQIHVLAEEFMSGADGLVELAERLASEVDPRLAARARPELPKGVLTRDNWAWVVGGLLPEGAIVCDESITAGLGTLSAAMAGAPPHDVLGLVGLALGQGLPLAVGAAIACPDRSVICLEGDGGVMYTPSALWTHAHEGLDITTVVLNNRSYAILREELNRVAGRRGGRDSRRMLDLTQPELDFVALSEGLGVPASRARTAEELAEQFAAALTRPGPHLIEAVLTAD